MKLETIPTGPADRNEIRRYMGYYRIPGAENQPGESFEMDPDNGAADTDALIERALSIAAGALEDTVLSERYPLQVENGTVLFGSCSFESKDLARRLSGCSEVVLFAATSGFRLDRLIEKYKRTEPATAYALSMVGTEHTEALCDAFCRRLTEEVLTEGKEPVLRYSPGYGDLPLIVQKDIFRQLDITRRIGVTLNESMLMTPVKTVTAIVGLRRKA